jgi:hypothetical protein
MNQTRNTNNVVELYEQSEGQFSAPLVNVDPEVLRKVALKMIRNGQPKTPKGKGNPYLVWQVQSVSKPHLSMILYRTRIEGHFTIWANFKTTIKW